MEPRKRYFMYSSGSRCYGMWRHMIDASIDVCIQFSYLSRSEMSMVKDTAMISIPRKMNLVVHSSFGSCLRALCKISKNATYIIMPAATVQAS